MQMLDSDLLMRAILEVLDRVRKEEPNYLKRNNYLKLMEDLLTRDEIAVMDGGKCILQLRGVRPFFSDKYDLTKHPNYKYTSDYDKKYTFDIEKYLNRRMKLKADDEYDVIEA
jgi:Type IV secretory pathway, VirD4 components